MKYQEFYNEGMALEQFNEVVEKIVQSESDRVRTKYSTELKDLQSKLPKEKTQEEIELETRLNELEAKEREYKLKDTLSDLGLPSQLAKYLKGSDDLESFGKEFAEILNQQVLNSSYKPSNRKPTESTISKEQFKKMGYAEREQLFSTNPEVYKALSQ